MVYSFHDCTLDTDRRELRRGNAPVRIEPQVFDLIEYLIRNRERVVSRDELLASIWAGRVVSESALDSRLNAARTAIGDSGSKQAWIKTFPRKGVRFVGQVDEEQEQAPSAELLPLVAGLPPVATTADRPSIAVLAFTNMSDDPSQEYFADGMADEIITALSRCNWLFVIARNSSFIYKGRAVDVRQVGRELGVKYVLEGSVRRGGDRLRITGQLSNAASGIGLWADRFEGGASDLFELQDRVAQSVVAAIEPSLQLAEIESLKQKSAANLDAYDLWLQALKLEYEFTEESLVAAIRLAEQAIAIDPAYARALALAAYCHAERRFQGWTRDPAAETQGLRLAERAIELGKDDANVLWMAAYAIRELGMDIERSMELVTRSLALNPNSAIAATIAAWNQIVLGDAAGAIELLDRAERSSPRDPRGWFMSTARALACLAQGDFGKAAASARRALAQNPHSAQSMRFLAASLAHLGEIDAARAAAREALRIDPHLTLKKLRARIPFMPAPLWDTMAQGLQRAGFAEE